VTICAKGKLSENLFLSFFLTWTRPFDCAVHFCSRPCHPPSPTPPLCPRSPTLITHCPCGKQELRSHNISFFPPDVVLARTARKDPIPTCTSMCMKPLEKCNHVCSARCSDIGEGVHDEILCDRPCSVLRACNRHQCNRVCCHLGSLALAAKGKGKKRGVQAAIGESGLHECDLVCGKVLSCGNHQCDERDHRGFCPPCLRSSFEEVCMENIFFSSVSKLYFTDDLLLRKDCA
jgi:transcriptional repressor NF-X1